MVQLVSEVRFWAPRNGETMRGGIRGLGACGATAYVAIILVAPLSCGGSDPRAADEAPLDHARITAEITEGVWAFHAADTARDAEGVIALLWPEYEMLVDGQRTSYAEVAAGSRQFMASLDRFHTIWTDLRVIPLSRDFAHSSFLFVDSIVASSGRGHPEPWTDDIPLGASRRSVARQVRRCRPLPHRDGNG